MSEKRAVTVLIGAIVMFTGASVIAATHHVDLNDPSAFSSIQQAIDSTSHFDTVVVHEGVYHENIDFHGRAITVKSVDPGNADVVANTIIDGGGATVVTFSHGETAFTKLEGISLRNGDDGVYCDNYDCRPQITNCVVYGNNDDGFFGGLPALTGCVIRDNNGDGIDSCSESIRGCTITGNRFCGVRNHYGDLIDCIVSENGEYGVSCDRVPFVQIKGCTISKNADHGVFCYISGPDVTLVNTLLSGNGNDGARFGSSSASVTNCTVVGNQASGLEGDGSSQFTAVNCIIAWNGTSGITAGSSATATSRYNNVYSNGKKNYGDTEVGEGDMQENPWFAGNGFWSGGVWHEGDYHLLSTVGRWDPDLESWVIDPIGSPCLDKGDPDMLFGDEPYPHGGRLNLGVYGGTVEASKSEGVKPICIAYPTMDFNKDCKVDQADLDIFMEQWLVCNLDPNDACSQE